MLISLGPWEQFGEKLLEHGVTKLPFLATERSATLMSFPTFNGRTNQMWPPPRTLPRGREPLGRCHCSRWGFHRNIQGFQQSLDLAPDC